MKDKVAAVAVYIVVGVPGSFKGFHKLLHPFRRQICGRFFRLNDGKQSVIQVRVELRAQNLDGFLFHVRESVIHIIGIDVFNDNLGFSVHFVSDADVIAHMVGSVLRGIKSVFSLFHGGDLFRGVLPFELCFVNIAPDF